MKNPHLFEICAWPWLKRISARENRRVTLDNVPAADWDAIAAHGFTQVFLMGVWRRSVLGRELARQDAALRADYDRALPGWNEGDVVGSPYCISEYVPDPWMGGWPALEAARRELNSRGISLILDFVPNHTALDHPWTREHPERYVLGSEDDLRAAPGDFRRLGASIIALGRDPGFPPWRDVAQLNYFNPDTRHAMAAELRSIGSHCDGVRCDMAMLLLNDVFDRTWRGILRARWPRPVEEFWPAVIPALPEMLFLAEVYWDLEWSLQQQGFHYTYDKRLLDRLYSSSPGHVRGHLHAELAYSERLARFLENHDEPRSATALASRLPAAAALFATLPGMRFYFDGQLHGRRTRFPVQLGRWAEEPVDTRLATIYERLLQTTARPLFHAGEWKLIEVSTAGDDSFADLIAHRWRLDDRMALIVANLGEGVATGHVPAIADLPRAEAYDFVDELNTVSFHRTRRSLDVRGLYVRLEPAQAHVFIVQPNRS
jgi:hypothetical protein